MNIAIAIQKEKNAYGVVVPDFPGCVSAGDSYEEAMVNAKEAIECHLEGLVLDGEQLPEIQPIEVHKANSAYQGDTWAMVAVDLQQVYGVAKRINITIPAKILKTIDAYIAKTHENRSAFLARAALEALQHKK